jgi:hypothetical protein
MYRAYTTNDCTATEGCSRGSRADLRLVARTTCVCVPVVEAWHPPDHVCRDPSKEFIPPYLQGEPAPELLCVYDSDDVGFFQDSGDHVSSNETGPRETDQISNNDILRLNNKVSRAISHYLESKGIKGHGRNDPDLTDEATQAILMDLFGDDYDNNWIDEDFEDGEWPFAEEGLEDQMDDFLGAMLAQEDLDLSEESSDYDDEDDEDDEDFLD